MTFGEQNTEAEGFAQLDRALDAGINFIDTAEMYPVPPRDRTTGATEIIVGNWLQSRGRREDIVLATKATGPGNGINYIRGGVSRHSRSDLTAAIDGSLSRLKTDYVDLYQLHWPARSTNFFGKLGYAPGPADEPVDLLETLEALGELVQAGKVRHIGLSNETPWGVMRFLELAQQHNLPRMVSIQNPYNLLNRSFEVGLAEVALREQVPLLTYSPLAFGMLTGKYHADPKADGRIARFSRFTRYSSPEAHAATAAYLEVAERHGLTPATLAIAFCVAQPFCASTIIGATTLAQLDENIDAGSVRLSEAVLDDLEAVHRRHTIPCP